MRLFIAIEPPEEAKSRLSELARQIRDIHGLRFARPEQMDLTLLFLGERDDVDEIKRKLSEIKFNSFEITIGGHGFFANEKDMRVGWLAVEKSPGLLQLQRKISESLGMKSDHDEFVPHITYARMKSLKPEDKTRIIDAAKGLDDFRTTYSVKDFKLYCTEFTEDGAVHNVVKEFPSE